LKSAELRAGHKLLDDSTKAITLPIQCFPDRQPAVVDHPPR